MRGVQHECTNAPDHAATGRQRGRVAPPARAEALGDDLDKVTGTSLDKGVELDALDLRDVREQLNN